jgi:shikimate dehydrogenase
MTNLYGLTGYPLSHSFSKKYFTEKFLREGIEDSVYELFPIEKIELFPSLIASHPQLRGLNVTIPYKEQVLLYLDELSDAVKEIGACNCIAFENGKLIGYNTDGLNIRCFLCYNRIIHMHWCLAQVVQQKRCAGC